MKDPPFWRCIYLIFVFPIGSRGCSLLCLLDGRMEVFPSKGFKTHANHFETKSDSIVSSFNAPSSEPKWLSGAAGSPKRWWVLSFMCLSKAIKPQCISIHQLFWCCSTGKEAELLNFHLGGRRCRFRKACWFWHFDLNHIPFFAPAESFAPPHHSWWLKHRWIHGILFKSTRAWFCPSTVWLWLRITNNGIIIISISDHSMVGLIKQGRFHWISKTTVPRCTN